MTLDKRIHMKRLIFYSLVTVLFCSFMLKADLREATGRITLLRVHDVGTKYGPPTDQIDVEAVIQLNTQPGKSFGFQLRQDGNAPAREAMLSLLKDAFDNNMPVTIDYLVDPGKNNGIIIRVWLTR